MSLTFFIVGAVIFAVYVYLMIWSIFYNNRKQQEENYPNLTAYGEESITMVWEISVDFLLKKLRKEDLIKKKKNELSDRT